MDEFLGIIKIFGGNFAPRGWALCNGQLLSISQNTALFSILGTTYGGNGQTTFALPNLQGRVPVGMGTAQSGTTYIEGEVGGVESVSLVLGNLPPHTHPLTGTVQLPCNGELSNADSPEAAYPAVSNNQIYNTTPSGFMGNLNNTLAIGIAGNGLPVENRMPFLAVNYIICLEGLFPSRN
jgi:microcystin-dependent protein